MYQILSSSAAFSCVIPFALRRVFRRPAKLAVSKLYILFPFRLMRGAEGYTCMQYGPEPSEPDKGAKR